MCIKQMKVTKQKSWITKNFKIVADSNNPQAQSFSLLSEVKQFLNNRQVFSIKVLPQKKSILMSEVKAELLCY